MLIKVRDNGFILCLLLMVPLAWLLPEAGRTGGWLRAEYLIKAGVFLIFLMQGLSLPTEQLLRGVLHWRLHAFVQSWNFLWAPVLGLVFVTAAAPFLNDPLHTGFLYLAILPTTVSTALVFTGAARGDVPGALFNTALSNVLAVLIVPAWCLILFATGGDLPPAGPMFVQLSLLILLPTLLGQAVRPFFGKVLPAVRSWFKPVSNGIICFAVFAAFADSFHNAVWERTGWAATGAAFAGVVVFLALVSVLVWRTARLAFASKETRIAAFFCGSQKSIATGVPMAAVIFSDGMATELSLILLPLLFYHPLQLVLGSFLVDRWGRRPHP
ncbi:MAG: bile acid:sodium symporter [Opitutales bacterium]|nr:bile acid:sodium symporter [Opitutales bacterium]